MMLKFFDTSTAVAAGESLAKIVMDSVPPTVQDNELKHAKKVSTSMRKMAQQIEWLKLQHKFNFLQKAKLGNTLRWKLQDAGYQESYVKELTEWVVLRLK